MPENSSCIPAAFTSAIFGAYGDGKDFAVPRRERSAFWYLIDNKGIFFFKKGSYCFATIQTLTKILVCHGYSNQMTKPKFRQVGHASQRWLIERNGTVLVHWTTPYNTRTKGRPKRRTHVSLSHFVLLLNGTHVELLSSSNAQPAVFSNSSTKFENQLDEYYAGTLTSPPRSKPQHTWVSYFYRLLIVIFIWFSVSLICIWGVCWSNVEGLSSTWSWNFPPNSISDSQKGKFFKVASPHLKKLALLSPDYDWSNVLFFDSLAWLHRLVYYFGVRVVTMETHAQHPAHQ